MEIKFKVEVNIAMWMYCVKAMISEHLLLEFGPLSCDVACIVWYVCCDGLCDSDYFDQD